MREATLDDDQAADKSAKHGGVKHRNCGRVRDVTNEEPLPGRTNKQNYYDGGNACQEGEGYPEKPVHTAEGHRPSSAHVDHDEGRHYEETRLAECKCKPEPSRRACAESSGARARSRRRIDPLAKHLPDKQGH